MWTTPAERCFLWMGGFCPSELIKILMPQLDPLMEQQLMGICNLQQSSNQAEEALSQGLEQLHQSLVDTISSGSLNDGANVDDYMGQMAISLGKLSNLEGFVHQSSWKISRKAIDLDPLEDIFSQPAVSNGVMMELMRQGAMLTVLSTLLVALAWLATLLVANDFIDNKWLIPVGVREADKDTNEDPKWGGTVALLTYILREQKEFSSTTCFTFAPAACMTWDLAESRMHFITTITNGFDMVSTFSTASIDVLHYEVTTSTWLSDLWDHTRILNVVYRFSSTLGSRLPSIASTRARVAGAGASLLPVSSSTQALSGPVISIVVVLHGCLPP
ncbi:hypothetical protein IFM89_012842 [Coptis chinensis]|uniref:DOG1 domain-containing protein n=1 Tax=Coptis chinensis TaxID=261450 RepID=A0A835IT70_9MAGN|nr:hypothetical protein IFM89_012842 [Coptis chinensis]